MFVWIFDCSHGYNRFLTIYKKKGKASNQDADVFNLMQHSQHQIQTLLQQCPVTQREKQELLPRTDRTQSNDRKSFLYIEYYFMTQYFTDLQMLVARHCYNFQYN